MLARLRKMADREDEGFTLIELLVVIIIIGILAAIAIPVFLSQKSKGYEASMKSDLRTVAQDVESANVDLQNYTNVPFGGTKLANTLMGAATAPSITGTGQVAGNENGTVNLSNGNTIAVTKVTANGYCLKATSTKATTATWYYTNQGGGITSADCTNSITP